MTAQKIIKPKLTNKYYQALEHLHAPKRLISPRTPKRVIMLFISYLRTFTQFFLFFMVFSTTASAAIIVVGPSESIKRIADAVKIAKDGDIIEIQPGNYVGDVASWPQKKLTLRGRGTRPVLIADGKAAQGKAIWVISNGDFIVQNIEFRGVKVSDGNGAGIRFEHGKLHVINCAFFDNQNGILTTNDSEAELIIENSIFAEAPKTKRPLPHLLYVGNIASLTLIGSRFHSGFSGHLVKSRARKNDIRYNIIHDGETGSASYEIEFPNGGDVTLVGNVISQSSASENPTIIAYGAESEIWPVNALTLIHNTIINAKPYPAWFLRVWRDRVSRNFTLKSRNNLFIGLGLFDQWPMGDDHAGNFFSPFQILSSPETLDFSIRPDSLANVLMHPVKLDEELRPDFEFSLPLGKHRIRNDLHTLPGAIQTSSF